MSRSKRIHCRDFVEQVTDYLDGALEPEHRERIDRHLERCPDCARTLAQWREVIRLTGRLGDGAVEQLPTTTRAELLAAFGDQPPAPD